ncbi:MAG: pentapeptide repeat-containing protein [Pseudonocardiaceae bacterium]
MSDDRVRDEPQSYLASPVERDAHRRGAWTGLQILVATVIFIMGISILFSVILWLPQYIVNSAQGRSLHPSEITSAERANVENSVRTTLIQAFGGLLLLVGATFTLRQLRLSREQLNLSWTQQELNTQATMKSLEAGQRAQLSDAFTRAVDQFGSERLGTRLGGIASLERVARDDCSVRDIVMEMLCAAVRSGSLGQQGSAGQREGAEPVQFWGQPFVRPEVDVQLAITVLGRLRNHGPSLEELLDMQDRGLLDFESANLRGVQMTLGHFEGAAFRRANLTEANLSGGFFESAVFFRTISKRANFAGDFCGASFDEADLSGCDFQGANLCHASFVNSVLVGASLIGADIRGVDFTGAVFEDEDRHAVFEGAIADSETTWPTGFDAHVAGVIINVPDETSE